MLIEIVIILVVLLVFLYCLTLLKVKHLRFYDWIEAEFFPTRNVSFLASPMNALGFVVSSDGKIYKIHLQVILKTSENTTFNNSTILISGVGRFVFRQFFQESHDAVYRFPSREDRTIRRGQIVRYNLELEPRDSWSPISLKAGNYKCLLRIDLLGKSVRKRFVVRVRPQNILRIEALSRSTGQVTIVDVPIV